MKRNNLILSSVSHYHNSDTTIYCKSSEVKNLDKGYFTGNLSHLLIDPRKLQNFSTVNDVQ